MSGRSSYEQLDMGTCARHLMECSAYVSGGYFAYPGRSDVEGFWNIGYPIAQAHESGQFYLSKLPGTGS